MSSMGFGTVGKKRQARPELILHPQIPKPLHNVAPRVVMGQAWWDDMRFKCYRASGRQCACCGTFFSQVPDFPTPEAHEVYSIDYQRGRAVFQEVVALCHWCHMSIHCGMVEGMLQQGQISTQMYQRIMEHREKRVKLALEAGHVYIDPGPGEKVPWADWRMVIDGQEFKPYFKSYGEWLRHYGEAIPLIEEEFFDSY